MLIQGALAALVNLALIGPIISRPPGWIVNAAGQPLAVSAAVMLSLVAAAVWLVIAVVIYPRLRELSERHALAFVALAAVAFALSAVENSRLLSLLSLSQAYASAAGGEREILEVLRSQVGAARNWAHYTHLIVAGVTIVLFTAAMWRFRLLPRALAGFGIAAAALQIFTVSMPVFGRPVIFALLAPLGIAMLAIALWLLAKGLAPRFGSSMSTVGS
jgi:hypothetical protein